MSDRGLPPAELAEHRQGCSGNQETNEQDSATRLVIPATVILERRIISRSFWSVPSWYLHTLAVGNDVVAGQQKRSASGTPAGSSDKGDLFVWSGFTVTLYRDVCERYWHALIGDKPLVYVLCRDEADGTDDASPSMCPTVVTLDYDEASAAAETDTPVLSAPIPGELYNAMERFVLAHYRPQQFKKRKRRDWSEEGSQQGRGAGSGGAANTDVKAKSDEPPRIRASNPGTLDE